jgi:hypothetical protein
MPVPFPSAADVRLVPPDAAETRMIAGAVAGAIAPADGLTSLQRVLVEALIESMTGFVVPVARVPRVSAAEFARAMSVRNQQFRERMVQFMLLCSLVLNPLPPDVVARVESYAAELGIADPMLRIAERFSHGSLGLALIDFQRSGYMETWDSAQAAELHTSRALADAWDECVCPIPSSRNVGRRCAVCRKARSDARSPSSTTRADSTSPARPAARRRSSRSTIGCTS